jgi:hypothetical protein
VDETSSTPTNNGDFHAPVIIAIPKTNVIRERHELARRRWLPVCETGAYYESVIGSRIDLPDEREVPNAALAEEQPARSEDDLREKRSITHSPAGGVSDDRIVPPLTSRVNVVHTRGVEADLRVVAQRPREDRSGSAVSRGKSHRHTCGRRRRTVGASRRSCGLTASRYRPEDSAE